MINKRNIKDIIQIIVSILEINLSDDYVIWMDGYPLISNILYQYNIKHKITDKWIPIGNREYEMSPVLEISFSSKVEHFKIMSKYNPYYNIPIINSPKNCKNQLNLEVLDKSLKKICNGFNNENTKYILSKYINLIKSENCNTYDKLKTCILMINEQLKLNNFKTIQI